MKFLYSHRKLLCFVGLSFLGILGLWKGTIEENILALVPQHIKQQVMLFEHSPLSQKLIVITRGNSATQAQQVAGEVRDKLLQEGFITLSTPLADKGIFGLVASLPSHFSQQAQTETAQKLSEEAITKQLDRYYEGLFSFQGMLVTQQMMHDPFGLTEILFRLWGKLGQSVPSLTYQDGFLSDSDGTQVAGLYDTRASVSDISAAQQLQRFFSNLQSALPENTRVFFMGGLRYTLENTSLIKRDLTIITLIGIACLGIVFICFFRSKRALLIYLLPILVLPPAAWITQLVFGHISGITLGFGSVVVGLSVDYAIYIYFALQRTQTDPQETVSKISRHLWCNFLTSGLCFVSLLFSSIEVFKQIAVFALVALSLAFAISVWVFPLYFEKSKNTYSNEKKVELNPLPFKAALVGLVLLLLFGVWGGKNLSINSDLASLNSTSASFAQDRQTAESLFPSTQGALLFSLGKTEEEALQNNERLSAQLPGGLPVSELFSSEFVRQQNQKRWREFWNEERINQAKELLQREAQKKGFSEQAFDPFWRFLQDNDETSAFDFTNWYNPVIKISQGLYAVVNIVPNEDLYAQTAQKAGAVFISASMLQTQLAQSVKKEAIRVVILALLLNLIALGLLLRKVKETVLCFIPVLAGGCFLLGCLALFHISVNLFGLIFLPLLIGLGIDYAIFQLMKYQSKQAAAQLYPTQALIAAGLSTLAGFGVLIFAKHAVLFMMGACALIGIGGTVGVSLFILPAFWEKKA